MEVQIEDISPVEKKIAVEIPWEQVSEKLDAAYRELGKGIQLRGFRKGKVPRSMLERLFGKQVKLDVAKELVQESFIAAARNNKIDLVAEPIVEDATIRAGEAFRFQARLEVQAPVELKEYESLPAKRRKPTVTDAQVAEALEQKRRDLTEYRAIEGRTTTALSDIVVVSLKGKIGDYPVDRKGVAVDLGQTDNRAVPGLTEALTGIDTSSRELSLSFTIPADAVQKEIAGQQAELQVVIEDVREKRVPSLDDEFAKDTGEAETLAEFREKVRVKLEQLERGRIDREVREEILAELVRRNPVAVAPSVLERSLDTQVTKTKFSLSMMGIAVEDSGIDLKDLRERLRGAAEIEVRGQLLLEALADKHAIEVNEADLQPHLAELAAAKEKSVQKMRAEMEASGALEPLRRTIRHNKALDLVVSRATITDADADEDTGTSTNRDTGSESAGGSAAAGESASMGASMGTGVGNETTVKVEASSETSVRSGAGATTETDADTNAALATDTGTGTGSGTNTGAVLQEK
ncbi:MAG: trigger factor [Pseudomonadota bacterium]